MTQKLFYEDCHLTRFSAHVTACTRTEKGYEITLDATAFYPEGGGQGCDLGTLGDANVLDARERGEEIIHLCDRPLSGEVTGEIDWARRFDLMQQHTGEHILSGILHRRYGVHNTGFHIGLDLVTIDFDGVIPTGDLPGIEEEANRAVWRNLPVKCWIPGPKELETVIYRTKRALPWPVRIVEVPGFDTCACCGVHVAATGEVGLVKIFSAVPFRGGTRLEIGCGGRALGLLTRVYEQNKLVSQAFSAKILETGEAAARMNEQLAQAKFRETGLQRKLFAGIADGYAGRGNVLHREPELEPAMVRELADTIAAACGGIAAVFSGDDEHGYRFCLISRSGDLRSLGKAMTAALRGRGGGKPDFQQGSVQAGWSEIEDFFRDTFQ